MKLKRVNWKLHNMPLVSVIIPNYNHAPYLEQRIDSVLNQTFQDFEVILLDDKSTDDSLEIIDSFVNHPKFSHVVLNEKNSGSTFLQWKKGIELAKGKYIWIAESDDWAEKNFLEELVGQIEKNREVVLAYCQSNLINSENDVFGRSPDLISNYSKDRWKQDFFNKGIDESIDFLIMENTIYNASAVLFDKEAINKESDSIHFKLLGDMVFWIEILQKGNVIYSHKRLNNFRFHEANVRSSMKNKQYDDDFIRLMDFQHKRLKNNRSDDYYRRLEQWAWKYIYDKKVSFLFCLSILVSNIRDYRSFKILFSRFFFARILNK